MTPHVTTPVPDEFDLDVRTVELGRGTTTMARSIDEPDCQRTLAARCSEQEECTWGGCGAEMTRPVTECGCPSPAPSDEGSCPRPTCEEPCEWPKPPDPEPQEPDPQDPEPR